MMENKFYFFYFSFMPNLWPKEWICSEKFGILPKIEFEYFFLVIWYRLVPTFFTLRSRPENSGKIPHTDRFSKSLLLWVRSEITPYREEGTI
jgi:hypothetical protein